MPVIKIVQVSLEVHKRLKVLTAEWGERSISDTIKRLLQSPEPRKEIKKEEFSVKKDSSKKIVTKGEKFVKKKKNHPVVKGEQESFSIMRDKARRSEGYESMNRDSRRIWDRRFREKYTAEKRRRPIL
jgi:hypothetical protein